VAEEVLAAPVADRPNWTLPRLADEIERRCGLAHLPLALSVRAAAKGAFRWRRPSSHAAGSAGRRAVDRAGLRRNGC
jgi:hypothetical protein